MLFNTLINIRNIGIPQRLRIYKSIYSDKHIWYQYKYLIKIRKLMSFLLVKTLNMRSYYIRPDDTFSFLKWLRFASVYESINVELAIFFMTLIYLMYALPSFPYFEVQRKHREIKHISSPKILKNMHK